MDFTIFEDGAPSDTENLQHEFISRIPTTSSTSSRTDYSETSTITALTRALNEIVEDENQYLQQLFLAHPRGAEPIYCEPPPRQSQHESSYQFLDEVTILEIEKAQQRLRKQAQINQLRFAAEHSTTVTSQAMTPIESAGISATRLSPGRRLSLARQQLQHVIYQSNEEQQSHGVVSQHVDRNDVDKIDVVHDPSYGLHPSLAGPLCVPGTSMPLAMSIANDVFASAHGTARWVDLGPAHARYGGVRLPGADPRWALRPCRGVKRTFSEMEKGGVEYIRGGDDIEPMEDM